MKMFVKVKTDHRPEWYKKLRKQPVTLFRKTWVWSEKEEELYRGLCVGSVLHLCSGYSELGDCKIDINPNVKPNIVCDVHFLPFRGLCFDTVIIDPPWHGPQNWMKWEQMVKEMVRIARKRIILILGNLMYILPKPFKLKEAYIIKKISPQIKHVYIWERDETKTKNNIMTLDRWLPR